MQFSRVFIFCTSLLLLHFSEGVFAEMSMEEACGKIQACLESTNPASITDYACIKGSPMLKDTNQTITTATVAFAAYTSIRFKEIDEEIRKEMEELQNLRIDEKSKTSDMSWVDDISEKRKRYEARYTSICTSLGAPIDILGACKLPATTDAYPQTNCRTLAVQKARSWENVGYILVSKGIAKSHQNAKDTHVDKVKGKYAKLLEKFQSYQRTVGTAVSKIKRIITDPI